MAYEIPADAEVRCFTTNNTDDFDIDAAADFFNEAQPPTEKEKEECDSILTGSHIIGSGNVLFCSTDSKDPHLLNVKRVLHEYGYQIHTYSQTSPLEILKIKQKYNWPLITVDLLIGNATSCLRTDVAMNISTYAGATGVLETIKKIEKEYLKIPNSKK